MLHQKLTLLLCLFISTSYELTTAHQNSTQNNNQSAELFTKHFQEQKELQEKIIELLTLQLQIDVEKIQLEHQKIADRQAARQAEKEKGFSFTECGIVIRDTFLEEFNLRSFSIELCEGFIKTLKKLVMNKIIQESFNGVDYTFGTVLTRHVHPQAGIYPVTFLESGSLSSYLDKRKSFIHQEDPRVKKLNADCDKILKANGITQELEDAEQRVRNVLKAVVRPKMEDPEKFDVDVKIIPKKQRGSVEVVADENEATSSNKTTIFSNLD